MKKVVHLSLALATMSLAQQIPPIVDTAARTPSSQGIASPQKEAGQAQAEGEETERPAKLTLEVGAQSASVDGKKSFGFQAYRDVPQGAFIRRFDYRVNGEGSPWLFSFRSQDLMQRDMTFNASLEKIGRVRIDLDFWSFSRYWSDRDRSVLVQARPGFLVVSDAMRSSVQATFRGAQTRHELRRLGGMRRDGGKCGQCRRVRSPVISAARQFDPNVRVTRGADASTQFHAGTAQREPPYVGGRL